jgi:hypothetical protein
MADAASKFTVFFQAQGSSTAIIGQAGNIPTGWTETYYSGAGLGRAAVDAFVAAFVQPRADLLGLGASIMYVRQTSVANPAQKRISYVRFMSGKQGSPSLFTSPDKDAYDFTAVDLLIRAQGVNGHRRQLWLGGIPESQADQLVQTGVIGAFTSSPAFKQWVNAILGQQLGLRVGVQAGAGTFEAFAELQPEMVRRRNRGRPFYLERGRKLA